MLERRLRHLERDLMTITATPLCWPPGWRRTEDDMRTFGRFGVRRQAAGRSYASLQDVTIAEATGRLFEELVRMRVERGSIILSTNLRLRLDGLPRSDQAAPRDPGAAAYWEDPFTGQPRCMAIDQYTKVEQNIAALAATIEAMRAIERHGGAIVMERAFTGFAALPPPIVAGMARPWWEVLSVARDASVDQIRDAWRRKASEHHPDRHGGDDIRMAEINAAREAALKEAS
jgi:hypothetical protein